MLELPQQPPSTLNVVERGQSSSLPRRPRQIIRHYPWLGSSPLFIHQPKPSEAQVSQHLACPAPQAKGCTEFYTYTGTHWGMGDRGLTLAICLALPLPLGFLPTQPSPVHAAPLADSLQAIEQPHSCQVTTSSGASVINHLLNDGNALVNTECFLPTGLSPLCSPIPIQPAPFLALLP